MLSSHTVGFQRPDNSNLANLTPGLCSSSWSWVYALNEFSPLSSFVIRYRFGDLIIHCRQPGRGEILFA